MSLYHIYTGKVRLVIKKRLGIIQFQGVLAETARFELAGDCSLTDFESAPL